MAVPKKYVLVLINFRDIWADEREGTLVARWVWVGVKGQKAPVRAADFSPPRES